MSDRVCAVSLTSLNRFLGKFVFDGNAIYYCVWLFFYQLDVVLKSIHFWIFHNYRLKNQGCISRFYKTKTTSAVDGVRKNDNAFTSYLAVCFVNIIPPHGSKAAIQVGAPNYDVIMSYYLFMSDNVRAFCESFRIALDKGIRENTKLTQFKSIYSHMTRLPCWLKTFQMRFSRVWNRCS